MKVIFFKKSVIVIAFVIVNVIVTDTVKQSSHSDDQVVEKARHAVLVCEASGSPKPTITWIKDTMPIDLKANPRLSLMKQGKLRGKASVEKFGRFYRQSQDILHFLLEPVFPMFVFGVNT